MLGLRLTCLLLRVAARHLLTDRLKRVPGLESVIPRDRGHPPSGIDRSFAGATPYTVHRTPYTIHSPQNTAIQVPSYNTRRVPA